MTFKVGAKVKVVDPYFKSFHNYVAKVKRFTNYIQVEFVDQDKWPGTYSFLEYELEFADDQYEMDLS